MRRRSSSHYVTVSTDVDVDVMEVLTDMTDEDLAEFDLYRKNSTDEGSRQVFLAVKDNHDTHHTGLVLGCTEPICRELAFDAATIIHETSRTP